MRRYVFVAALLFAISFCVPAQATLYEWGGAGSEASPAWWNDVADEGDGINADTDHWGVDGFPVLDGTDSVIVSSGGIMKSSLYVDSTSSLEVSGGYLWTGGFGIGKNTPGATVIVENAVLDSQWVGCFAGSTVEFRSGSWNLRGGGEPLNATMTGAIDFTGESGTFTLPNKSSAYIEGKILLGVLRIDGVQLTTVDEVVNGKHFMVDGTTLTLVPEPATVVLFGLGGLFLGRKRGKHS